MITYLHRFAELKNFLREHRKLLILIFAGAFLLLGFYNANAGDWNPDDEISRAILSSTIGILAAIVNVLAWAVGQLIIAVLGMLVIPILGYNNFGNSAIIDIGWPLVRDVVNMFVIVILLVIAIKTIINSKSANWEQQLPRLFIAVIFVNFSRTITLLIVDAGQVVMFTFVNALRDIAAGNFVSLFQLNSILELANQSGETDYGFELFGFLGTAYANLMLLGIVLAVVVVLAIVFVYRIIMIWVLVILSPIAFLMHGIKDVLPQAAGQASKWWDKLVGVVTLGPILVFFLWLGLAAATSGAIASTEGFDVTATEDASELYSKVFKVEQLLSLLIGIILIMVGFQAASGAAGAMGGIAATLVNEKSGTAIAKNVARMPAAAGYRVAKGAGKRALASDTGRQALQGLSSGFRDLGTKVAKSGVPGGALIGGAIISGSGKAHRALTAPQLEERREARKDLAGRPPEEVAAMYMASREATPATSAGVMQNEELNTRMTEDDDVADAVKDRMKAEHGEEKGEVEFNKAMTQAFAHRKSNVDTLDKDETKKYKDAQEENIRYLAPKDQEKVIERMNKEGRLHRITKEDSANTGVQQILHNKEGAPLVDLQTGEKLRDRSLMEQVLASRGLNSESRQNLQGKGMKYSEQPTKAVPKPNQPPSGAIKEAIKSGNLKVENITANDLTANRSSIAKGGALAGADFSNVPVAARKDLATDLETLSRSTDPGEAQNIAQYRKAYFSAEDNPIPALMKMNITMSGNIGGDATQQRNSKREIGSLIEGMPSQVHKFEDVVSAGAKNDVTAVIAEKVNNKVLAELDKRLVAADDTRDTATQTKIKDSLKVMLDAVKAEYSAVPAGTGGTGARADLTTKQRKINRILDNI